MSAIADKMNSLDSVLASIRADHERAMKEKDDHIFALTMKLELAQSQANEARQAELRWQRLATRFVTQFGTVRNIVDEVAKLAQQVEEAQQQEEQPQTPPVAAASPPAPLVTDNDERDMSGAEFEEADELAAPTDRAEPIFEEPEKPEPKDIPQFLSKRDRLNKR